MCEGKTSRRITRDTSADVNAFIWTTTSAAVGSTNAAQKRHRRKKKKKKKKTVYCRGSREGPCMLWITHWNDWRWWRWIEWLQILRWPIARPAATGFHNWQPVVWSYDQVWSSGSHAGYQEAYANMVLLCRLLLVSVSATSTVQQCRIWMIWGSIWFDVWLGVKQIVIGDEWHRRTLHTWIRARGHLEYSLT